MKPQHIHLKTPLARQMTLDEALCWTTKNPHQKMVATRTLSREEGLYQLHSGVGSGTSCGASCGWTPSSPPRSSRGRVMYLCAGASDGVVWRLRSRTRPRCPSGVEGAPVSNRGGASPDSCMEGSKPGPKGCDGKDTKRLEETPSSGLSPPSVGPSSGPSSGGGDKDTSSTSTSRSRASCGGGGGGGGDGPPGGTKEELSNSSKLACPKQRACKQPGD